MANEKTAEELAEEAAAQLAVDDKTADGAAAGAEGEGRIEPTKPTAPSTAAAPTIEQVVEKLAAALKPGTTPEQQEAQLVQLEKESGFTRQQLNFMSRANQKTAIQANLGLAQEVGKNRADKALGKFSPQLMSKVEEEMAKQPVEVQANPEAWTQMAFLVKGRHAEELVDTAPAGGGKKMPGLTNISGGGAGGGTPKASSKKYDADEQLMINQYFGGKPEAYEASKAAKTLAPIKMAETPGGNVADRELQRLTGGQA